MAVKIVGLEELDHALDEMGERIEDRGIATRQLAGLMNDYVHVQSGYLKSTVFFDSMVAGATAPYAGFEADRGGDHDFAQLALDHFNEGSYIDEIVEPF